jgi:flagellar biosynthesis protein FlhF
MSSLPASPAPGTKFQFIVSSAEEAVQIIQEKFAGNARVVSVKQMTGNGLTRLLSAPKLEIVAEITATAEAVMPAEAISGKAQPSEIVEAKEPPHQPQVIDLPKEPDQISEEPLERLLTRSGLSPRLLARLQANDRWDRIKRRPLRDSLNDVVDLLRTLWHKQPHREIGRHVAFYGSPGSGITTALCKALTMDIFFRKQPACVMKLDGDFPNPTEGLAMFCEALNVQLLRNSDGLESLPENHRVYFDIAGIPLNETTGWRDLGRLLGEFYVDTRVIVINAAYEMEVIKRTCGLALEAGTTHAVFTHLDEVQHWGKLWDCIISSGLTPMFLSHGQNVSGHIHENIFSTLVEKTFRIPTPVEKAPEKVTHSL